MKEEVAQFSGRRSWCGKTWIIRQYSCRNL